MKIKFFLFTYDAHRFFPLLLSEETYYVWILSMMSAPTIDYINTDLFPLLSLYLPFTALVFILPLSLLSL